MFVNSDGDGDSSWYLFFIWIENDLLYTLWQCHPIV